MKKLLLILSLLFITTNVYAEWKTYGTNNVGAVFFYDNSSIKRNGNKVKVWTYFNLSPNDNLSKSLDTSSYRNLFEIDCANETIKTLSLMTFTKPDLEGVSTNSTNPSSQIEYIAPNTVYAALMKLACLK